MREIVDGLERSLLQPVADAIDKEARPHPEVQALDKQIEYIERDYRVLKNAASTRIRSELAVKRATISDAVASGSSHDAILATLTQMGESIGTDLQKWMREELKRNVKGRISAALEAEGLAYAAGSSGGSDFTERCSRPRSTG